MYRENLEGLTEQICALEVERAKLEEDLARMRRITWPQKLGRGIVAAAVAAVIAGLAVMFGYGHGVRAADDARAADMSTAWEKIYALEGELAEAKRAKEAECPEP
jgi:hypothetical protein